MGGEREVTRRSVTDGHPGVRRGVPSWADPRPAPDAHAAQAVAVGLRFLARLGWSPVADVRAGVEHVVVGPGGAVVVRVVAAEDPPARRARRRRPLVDRPAGADPVVARAAQEAAASASVVTALLAPRHRSGVRAVVCTPGDAAPSPGPCGVTVLGANALVTHLRALPQRFGPVVAAGLTDHLRTHLGRTDLLTTADLEAVLRRRGAAVRPPGTDGLTATMRVGVVLSVAWLVWVFTTTPLGLT